MAIDDPQCFGFFLGGPICRKCVLEKKCKNVLLTHGLDIMAETLETLVTRLDPKGVYDDTDRVSEMADQILLPLRERTPEEEDLLGLIDDQELDPKLSAAKRKILQVAKQKAQQAQFSALPASDEEIKSAMDELLLNRDRLPSSVVAPDMEMELE